MTKFKFSLQTVLDVKAKWLRQKEDDIRRIKGEITQQEEKIRGIEVKINESIEQMNNSGVFTPDELSLYHEYLQSLNRILRLEELKKQELEEALEIHHQEMIKLFKEIKILEKLKEKEWENYQYDAQAEHQKLLDEIAVIQNRNGF